MFPEAAWACPGEVLLIGGLTNSLASLSLFFPRLFVALQDEIPQHKPSDDRCTINKGVHMDILSPCAFRQLELGCLA